jgi:hypothetical protein
LVFVGERPPVLFDLDFHAHSPLEIFMKTRALGLFLMVAGACTYGAGCGSSNNNGTGGATGTGGHATGGATGTGGHATGGATGTGGTTVVDAGNDIRTDTGPGTDVRPDVPADAPADAPTDVPTDVADAAVGPTFTQVFAILSNITTPSPDTAPGCANCHDGANTATDAAPTTLPHLLNFKDRNIAYSQLVGIPSLRCTTADGGTAVMRVVAGSSATSILAQKLSQGLGMGTACDGVGMPLQRQVGADGGPDGGADGGTTHYAITNAQLLTVTGWINAGARDN